MGRSLRARAARPFSLGVALGLGLAISASSADAQ